MYVASNENLPGAGVPGDSPGDSVGSVEDGGGGADFSLFDPGVFGLSENDLDVDFLDDEEGGGRPRDAFEELAHPAQGHLPKPGRRGRKKALARITEEDFEEGAERNAFLIVEDYARKLFGNRADERSIREAVSFFFTVEDNGAITFPLCCEVLRARADVIRLRIQYEWWLRGAVFTGPFPFTTVPVPKMIAGEALYYAGDAGFALARETWVQPGVGHDELLGAVAELDGFSEPELVKAVETLQDKFILSKERGWYLTGRNPLLQNIRYESIYGVSVTVGGSIHWSRLFGSAGV